MGGMLNTIKYRLSLHRRKSKDCGATVEDMQTRKTSDQPDRKAIISIEKKNQCIRNHQAETERDVQIQTVHEAA